MGSAGEVAGKVVFCLCGPIGSLCCFILSIWGVVMLVRLGIYKYSFKSSVNFRTFIERICKHLSYYYGLIIKDLCYKGIEY